MDLGVTDKKARVTGASRGIGRAIAELLAAEGASVAVCARGEDGVKEAVAAVEAVGKGKAWGGKADVANGEEVHRSRRNHVGPDVLGAVGLPGMPAFYESTLKGIPMGRMADQHDVARAVVFLASPAAGMMTGTNLVVDGGITKRVQL